MAEDSDSEELVLWEAPNQEALREAWREICRGGVKMEPPKPMASGAAQPPEHLEAPEQAPSDPRAPRKAEVVAARGWSRCATPRRKRCLKLQRPKTMEKA